MAATTSTLASALKEIYLGSTILSQVEEGVELYKWLGSAEATIDASGKWGILPLKISRNSGVGAVAEGAATPTAGQQGLGKLTVAYKFVYGSVSFSGPAIKAAKKNAGAFGTVVEIEMDGLVDDLKKYVNRVLVAGGDVIGFVWQKQNAATFQYSGRFADVAVGVVAGVPQTVGFYNTTTYAQIGIDTQLNAISANSLTLNAAIDTSAVAAGTVIAVVANSSTTGGFSISDEPQGILGNLAAQTWHGNNRSAVANAELRSNFIQTAVDAYASLGAEDMERAMVTAEQESGERPDTIYMAPAQKLSYVSLLQGTLGANLFVDARGTGKGDAGFSQGIGYSGIPISQSTDVPRGTILFLRKKDWKRVELGAPGWADEDGDPLVKSATTDTYSAKYFMYFNLICQKPSQQVVLTAVSF